MRQIKCRIWDKILKGWSLNTQHWLHLRTEKMLFVTPEQGERYIFEQFTGLLDKNGVEIYEGDIIYGDDEGNDIVSYKDNRFILEPLGDDCIYWKKSEVIGNIHENPELLERK